MMSPEQSSAGEQSAGSSTAESDAPSNRCATSSPRPRVGVGAGAGTGTEKKPSSLFSCPPPSPKKGFFSFAPKILTNLSQHGTGGSLSDSISNSAPTILIHTPSSDDPIIASFRRPLRSAMTSQTLHDSLHRGRGVLHGDNRSKMTRSVSFARVNIREYERVLGDNPSVRAGPPLSIGWRYAPAPLSITLDDYEKGKGDPRSSAEYLVPKAVRENILKEHAGVSRREMVAAVRTIKKEKAQRHKTVVNLSMQKTEEKIEKVRRKMKKILKPSSSYGTLEAELWDDAHAVAMEKAKRLEESLHRGESVTYMDLYSAGTPCNNILPSRRNSIRKEQSDTALLQSIPNQYAPKSTENKKLIRRSSTGELDVIDQKSPVNNEAKIPGSHSTLRTSDIVVTESDDEDIFAKKVGRIDHHASVNKGGRIPGSQRASEIVATESDDEDIFAKLLLADSTC